MAQVVAVVRGNLPDAAGSVDLTSTGLGTVAAAIIVVCNANNLNNPQDGANLSIAFWDGANQRVTAAFSHDAQETTIESRASDDGLGVLMLGATIGTRTCAYSVSAITDGLRLTLVADNTGAQRYVTCLLLAGVDASVFTFTPNATQNNTAAKTGLSFAPKLLLFSSIGDGSVDNEVTNSIISFGVARESDGLQRMWSQGHQNGVGTSNNTMFYSESRCVGQIFNGALTWAGEITTWASDGFTMTTRDGGTGGDVCFCLALGGADLSFDMGTLTTPAATGNDVVTTTIEPDALLALLSTCPGTTVETDSDAEGVSIGLSDGTNQYSHGTAVEDAAGTSNAESKASATNVVELRDSAGGTTAAVATATVSSFNATNFTLNWSAVPATARKGFWLAFGTADTGEVLTSETGSYTLTGNAATLTADRSLTGDAGSLTIAGNDATLTADRTIAADAGSYSLTGQDATLTQAHAIAPADAAHAHAADAPAITQVYEIAPADATHGHTAESPDVNEGVLITPDAATHAHAAESPAITQVHAIAPEDGLHGHASESPTITQVHVLVPADCLHGHTAESPAITQTHVVAPDDATHGHTAESPNIAVVVLVSVNDATHAHTAESPAITQVHVLAPADCLHAHAADSPTVSLPEAAGAYLRGNVRVFPRLQGQISCKMRLSGRISLNN